jgi:RNA polymerase sigma factor (TIGR02999 family)
LVYDQFQELARRHLSRERPGHTLAATALVHDAYIRLIGGDIDWQDRGHFFAIAAKTMRRILVDHAKAHKSAKCGQEVSLQEIAAVNLQPSPRIVDLNDALNRSEAADARKSKVIGLILFAGLTQEETAPAMGLSPATVYRELTFAKAWMVRELGVASL